MIAIEGILSPVWISCECYNTGGLFWIWEKAYLDKIDWIGVKYALTPPPWGGVGEVDMMKSEENLKRLKIVAGHLGGVIRMVEEDAYCIDVIRQIQAVQAALNKVSSAILENHLNSCVTTAIRGEDLSERERVLREITDVFETATKV
jgi:DNA-binding FrmR family transcriptional regulator